MHGRLEMSRTIKLLLSSLWLGEKAQPKPYSNLSDENGLPVRAICAQGWVTSARVIAVPTMASAVATDALKTNVRGALPRPIQLYVLEPILVEMGLDGLAVDQGVRSALVWQVMVVLGDASETPT